MAPAITLEVLPALRGDCLWVACDRPGRRPWRMLVDGGLPRTWPTLRARLEALPAADRRIDLVVVSHLDADHIGGMLPLLAATDLGVGFGDIWFNGFAHLPEPDAGPVRSFAEAARLADLLGNDATMALPWNEAFGGGAVTTGDAAFRELSFEDGPTLTLLSPTPKRLLALRRVWAAELARLQRGDSGHEEVPDAPRAPLDDLQALAATKTSPDDSVANGSSIAFLLEHRGASCLLAGDAFFTVLGQAVTALVDARGGERLAVDAFKLSHHASKRNVVSRLIELVPARHYIVSTNGDRFHHPDDVALARVVTAAPSGSSLWFNYATPATRRWGDPAVTREHDVTAVFPDGEAGGVRLELG